ncbi:MAG: penicillin-binding protein 2 [bacterium]
MSFFFNDRKSLRLDDSYTSLYIEEIELEKDAQLSDEEKNFIGFNIGFKKINLLMLFFVMMFFILVARVWSLQIMRGKYYSSIAEGNRIRIHYIKPRRGVIFDRNGLQLTSNIPSFSLKIIQSDLPKEEKEKDDLLKEIAVLIGEDYEEICSLLEENSAYYYQPVIIKENIDYKSALLLYVKSVNMPGIILEEVSKRFYISNDSLNSISHILGYNGKISSKELEDNKNGEYLLDDYIGKLGVESTFEKILRGALGKSQIETNAYGKMIGIVAKNDPAPGFDIILSIDYDLQTYIENLLKDELKKLKKERAAVIVINPNGGEILSLVSIPSFNNNLFTHGISNKDYSKLIEDKAKPLFNRAIAGEYPPGSTFKPIMAAAALEEGIITENTRVKSVGGIWVGKWFFPDWLAGGHGSVNVKNAIANSVNTFFYYVGGGYKDFEGLGIEKIYQYAKLFNLGKKTNIDLSGESDGFAPSALWKEEKFNEPWYIGDTYHSSIGQGYLLTTPLQIALYTSFFANGGILYKPKIVKAFIKNGEIEYSAYEYLNKDIINPKNVSIVKQGMQDTVKYGSASSLGSLSFTVAGKTGTAQTSNNKDTHAWFTCFAPYENPEIVITTLIEEGGEGSSVAVPITKKILEHYWNNIRK